MNKYTTYLINRLNEQKKYANWEVCKDSKQYSNTGWSRKMYTVAIGKPERQVRKASHCGSKQQ